MKTKFKKKPLLIGGTIISVVLGVLLFYTSPEYHCYNVAEDVKKDYIQFLYDGLPKYNQLMVDAGEGRIVDADPPIDDIRDRAYEFCVSQKPNVPESVIIEFEDFDG